MVKKNIIVVFGRGKTASNLSFVIIKIIELGRWFRSERVAGEPIRLALAKKFWNLSLLLQTTKTIFGKRVWAKC